MKTCCENHDCNQGRNCPNREPASQEAAFKYLSTILAGIGAFSLVMAIVIWSVK
jgi:hypothetical protein